MQVTDGFGQPPNRALEFFRNWVNCFYQLSFIASFMGLPWTLYMLNVLPEGPAWNEILFTSTKLAFVGCLYFPFLTVMKRANGDKLRTVQWVNAVGAGLLMIIFGFWLGIMTGVLISPIVVFCLVLLPVFALFLVAVASFLIKWRDEA